MKKLEKLLSSAKYDHAKPVNESEILRHEQSLKLKFSPAYKSFLATYGCLVVGANELYGICGDNALIPSAIHATLTARKDPKFPKDLLVIANDGAGRKFCINQQDQIYLYDGGSCQSLGKSFEDFAVKFLG